MPDRVLIPLPGIGTLSLTRAQYDAALVPVAAPETPSPRSKPAPVSSSQRLEPTALPNEPLERPRGLRYLRLPEVCERVGLKSTMVYRLMGSDRFPKQVKISERASRWVESEVEAFMTERMAERDRRSAPPAPASSPYMRMGEVMKRTGLKSSMLYDRIRDRTFPKWANLPKIASGWLKTDIESWLAARDEAALTSTADD